MSVKQNVNFELFREGTCCLELTVAPLTRPLVGVVVSGVWREREVALAYVVDEAVHICEVFLTHYTSQRVHPLTGQRLKEIVEL